jgi:hypothetical protein
MDGRAGQDVFCYRGRGMKRAAPNRERGRPARWWGGVNYGEGYQRTIRTSAQRRATPTSGRFLNTMIVECNARRLTGSAGDPPAGGEESIMEKAINERFA